jgi:hypothetical protein
VVQPRETVRIDDAGVGRVERTNAPHGGLERGRLRRAQNSTRAVGLRVGRDVLEIGVILFGDADDRLPVRRCGVRRGADQYRRSRPSTHRRALSDS